MPSPDVHIAVVGAGVVGLAVAARLSEQDSSLVVLEQNEKYGMETSSRNSEVIHAGIYYPPGSLKAELCRQGRDELYSLCRRHDIPHRRITKLIVAVADDELLPLETVYKNGRANDVPLEMLDASHARRLEPNLQPAGAVFSPLTGIISVHALMDHFYHTTVRNGGLVHHRCRVVGIEARGNSYALAVDDNGVRSTIVAEKVVNAAGLESDRIAALAGIDVDAAKYRLCYCKGSYFSVNQAKAKLISRLVYPVPHPETLGVHALFDLGGRLKLGPDVEYLADRSLDYAVDNRKRRAFLASVRKILPFVEDADISPDMSGIRPKLQARGEGFRDFVIEHEIHRGLPGFVNLIGIESPGLTASPAIARRVADLFSSRT